jgi:N-methylhydantoinase B
MRREYEILSERAVVSVYRQQCDEVTAPWSVEGGGPGRAAQAVLNPGKAGERALESKAIGLALTRGDVVRLEGAGGGGWGDPAKRSSDDAARDSREGYV